MRSAHNRPQGQKVSFCGSYSQTRFIYSTLIINRMVSVLLDLLSKLSLLILSTASIVGLLRFRQLSAGLRYLEALTWLYLLVESMGMLLQKLKLPNLFLIPLVVVGEFWLLTMVFKHALRWPTFNRVAPWVVGLLTAYVLLDSAFAFEAARFKPSVLVLSTLFTLTLAGLYFRKLLQELHVDTLRREPMFWVATALTISALGELLISLFSNYILVNYSPQVSIYVWAIHTLLGLVVYSCYGWALWIDSRRVVTLSAA
jgi:hypothetical protein